MNTQAVETDLPSVIIRHQATVGKSKAHIYLDRLASMAHPQGGWSYAPNLAPHPEPTCLALLALSLDVDSYVNAIRGGLEVLGRGQTSQGLNMSPGTQ